MAWLDCCTLLAAAPGPNGRRQTSSFYGEPSKYHRVCRCVLIEVFCSKTILLLDYPRMTLTAMVEKLAPQHRSPLPLLELSFALQEVGIRPERGC